MKNTKKPVTQIIIALYDMLQLAQVRYAGPKIYCVMR